jgi:hypothetical protein
MSVNPEITLSIVALLISIIFSRRQSRVAMQNLRMQRDNAIIQWSNKALEYLCSAEMILKHEFHSIMQHAEFEKARLGTMRDISACIDQGRLFFPNLLHEKRGEDKPAAYRGVRHRALDCLVFTYDLLDRAARDQDVHAFEAVHRQVTGFRREFISLVQSELDPRGLVRFLSGHLAGKAVTAASGG